MKNRYESRNGFNVGKLRGAIANSGKTQATISEELDIHPNTLSKWTTGERVPSPEKLYKVLSACGWESFILHHLRMADFYEVPVVDDGIVASASPTVTTDGGLVLFILDEVSTLLKEDSHVDLP